MNCTFESMSLWDVQEIILRGVEENGISTLDHRGYLHLDLESPLDITRPTRLKPVGSVLSASPQRTDPIFLFLSGHIPDDAVRVHQIYKYHNITRLDASVILGDSAVCRIRALVCGDPFIWLNRMLLSLFILGFSCGYFLTIYHLLHFVWSSLHSILFSVDTVTDDPHFCLLLQARMAYGLIRIQRMSL